MLSMGFAALYASYGSTGRDDSLGPLRPGHERWMCGA